MNARILKKIRSFRFATAMTVIGLTLISFQNCAPAQLCADGSSSANSACPENSSELPSTGSGNNNNSGSGTVIGGGGGGGFGSTGGSVSNGGGSGSGSGTVIIGDGGGSSGGGFGGGGTSGGGSSGGSDSNVFKIYSQPSSISVNEFGDFKLEVSVSGGTPPYSYQWYKDGTALSALIGTYSMYFDNADSYTKEGNYYVKVRDANGAAIESTQARVSITEPAIGCSAGTYFTFTNATYDYMNMIPGFLDSPRGKHLLPSNFPNASVLFSVPAKYTGLNTYSFGATNHGAQAVLSCRSTVPRIHTPTKNPQYMNEYSSVAYNDTAYWQYQGAIVFECRAQKLRFVANTCKWVQVKAFDDNYNPGYNDSPSHGN